jgi:hypothetical protein
LPLPPCAGDHAHHLGQPAEFLIGMLFQECLTDLVGDDRALYNAASLRAFENELGVQTPVSFGDPACLAVYGATEML